MPIYFGGNSKGVSIGDFDNFCGALYPIFDGRKPSVSTAIQKFPRGKDSSHQILTNAKFVQVRILVV